MFYCFSTSGIHLWYTWIYASPPEGARSSFGCCPVLVELLDLQIKVMDMEGMVEIRDLTKILLVMVLLEVVQIEILVGKTYRMRRSFALLKGLSRNLI